MKPVRIALLFLFLFPLLSNGQAKSNPVTLKLGSRAPEFKLKGIDGKNYSMKSFRNAKILVIIFSAPHCPTAQAYEDRIIAIQNEYVNKGVRVVMVNPNNPGSVCLEERGYTDLGDSFEEMKIRAADKKYNFPFLFDGEKEEMAMVYGPIATPHTFIFDENRILRYVGRIDDSEKIGTAATHEVRDAIEAILAGKDVPVKETKVFGCSVKWKWKNASKLKLDDEWKRKEVKLENISLEKIKELIRNNGEKLRVINIWATWCGPCVAEFSELVDTYRMFQARDFEMFTISTDKPALQNKVKSFLQEKNTAITGNYIFETENKYDLIETIDPQWNGEIPYTIIVEPGGKIYCRFSGGIDALEFRRKIVEHPLIGRYF